MLILIGVIVDIVKFIYRKCKEAKKWNQVQDVKWMPQQDGNQSLMKLRDINESNQFDEEESVRKEIKNKQTDYTIQTQ